MLFFRNEKVEVPSVRSQANTSKLFAQVIFKAEKHILELWERGDKFIPKEGFECPNSLSFDKSTGRGFYQCQPHFWQCYWSGGVKKSPEIKIEVFGQTYHIEALPNFAPISEYSAENRFYELVDGENFRNGLKVDLSVKEFPNKKWSVVLIDSCRDTFLPERIYGHGQTPSSREEDFIWDNFDRKIFIDKWYVSNQQINDWFLKINQGHRVIKNKSLWANPAELSLEEQHLYCKSLGKRLLSSHLFDAASMTPINLSDPLNPKVLRPQTPWQRDISKTFLGMARKNSDYQLTPLDCMLAQVEGCADKLFYSDSVSWMGMNYPLGFYPESLVNEFEPKLNLKRSSKFLPAASLSHELGKREYWNGTQPEVTSVAFRCYEEVSE